MSDSSEYHKLPLQTETPCCWKGEDHWTTRAIWEKQTHELQQNYSNFCTCQFLSCSWSWYYSNTIKEQKETNENMNILKLTLSQKWASKDVIWKHIWKFIVQIVSVFSSISNSLCIFWMYTFKNVNGDTVIVHKHVTKTTSCFGTTGLMKSLTNDS